MLKKVVSRKVQTSNENIEITHKEDTVSCFRNQVKGAPVLQWVKMVSCREIIIPVASISD